MAAWIFSLTIRSASRRARLPPRISFIIRSATTPFASSANIIKELNIRRPLDNCRTRMKVLHVPNAHLISETGLVEA